MKTLNDVTAGDLMQTEVITLEAGATIREAIETFEDYHIQGAPVVDSAGNLMGVLSATDVAKSGHVQADRIENDPGEYYVTDPLDELGPDGSRRSEEFYGKDEYSPEVLGEQTVGDWMTPKVISVHAETPIQEVCQLMVRESIHRVCVVHNSQLQGIVTTFDIVKWIAE